jgi:hypothetical protein
MSAERSISEVSSKQEMWKKWEQDENMLFGTTVLALT